MVRDGENCAKLYELVTFCCLKHPAQNDKIFATGEATWKNSVGERVWIAFPRWQRSWWPCGVVPSSDYEIRWHSMKWPHSCAVLKGCMSWNHATYFHFRTHCLTEKHSKPSCSLMTVLARFCFIRRLSKRSATSLDLGQRDRGDAAWQIYIHHHTSLIPCGRAWLRFTCDENIWHNLWLNTPLVKKLTPPIGLDAPT